MRRQSPPEWATARHARRSLALAAAALIAHLVLTVPPAGARSTPSQTPAGEDGVAAADDDDDDDDDDDGDSGCDDDCSAQGETQAVPPPPAPVVEQSPPAPSPPSPPPAPVPPATGGGSGATTPPSTEPAPVAADAGAVEAAPSSGEALPPPLEDDGRSGRARVISATRSFTGLFVLAALLAAFLAGQNRFTRRDPKLAESPVDRDYLGF